MSVLKLKDKNTGVWVTAGAVVVGSSSGTGEGSTGSAVTSVNNKTGAVTLTASDVGALPDTTVIPAAVTDDHINDLIDAKLQAIDGSGDTF